MSIVPAAKTALLVGRRNIRRLFTFPRKITLGLKPVLDLAAVGPTILFPDFVSAFANALDKIIVHNKFASNISMRV
jgi:hypothetical protein